MWGVHIIILFIANLALIYVTAITMAADFYGTIAEIRSEKKELSAWVVYGVLALVSLKIIVLECSHSLYGITEMCFKIQTKCFESQ